MNNLTPKKVLEDYTSCIARHEHKGDTRSAGLYRMEIRCLLRDKQEYREAALELMMEAAA